MTEREHEAPSEDSGPVDELEPEEGQLEQEEGQLEQEEGEEAPPPAVSERPAPGRKPAPAPARPAPPSPSDLAVKIDDRISAVFVLVAILTFVGIFLYGIFLGAGGVFTPLPSPSPIVLPSPSVEASGTPSAEPTAEPSPEPSATPGI